MFTMIVINDGPSEGKRIRKMLFKAGFRWPIGTTSQFLECRFLFVDSKTKTIERSEAEAYSINKIDSGCTVWLSSDLTQEKVNKFAGAEVKMTREEVAARLGIPNLEIVD